VRALTEGLRMELHSQNIRCTMISPGAIATELSESSSDEATRKNLREFMKMAIPASAIEQPVEVEVDEMVIRPTVQDF
jgi:NADP-dependent 3-hydroxy acid dehydrogenase YdfG